MQVTINPFQKASKAEAEREVPADAVLLSVADYNPVGMAVWEAGQPTPYRHISRAFQSMESTTKRLRIGDAIANMFRSILALSPGASWLLTLGAHSLLHPSLQKCACFMPWGKTRQ